MDQRTLGRISLGLALAILVGGAGCAARPSTQAQAARASIERDCAPWDGSAFTLSAPLDDGSVVAVSIWRAPDIAGPVTFSFPDPTGRVGQAAHRMLDGSAEPLSGSVSFEGVRADAQVRGEMRLRSDGGRVFETQFVAEWGGLQIACG